LNLFETNVKISKRKLQAEQTRNRIYKVAIGLIEKYAFDDIKIQDICRIAGVSTGSFYNCFKSKNDILNEMFLRADNHFKDEVTIKIKTLPTAAEQIRTFFSEYAFYNDMMGVASTRQIFNPKNKLFTVKGRYMLELLEGILINGQRSCELTLEMNSWEMVLFLFTCAKGVVFDWCLDDGKFNLIERMNKVISRILISLKTQ
jgi:TetR/AcrR family transcriptional regulator, fatty acid metabolism regulator protein